MALYFIIITPKVRMCVNDGWGARIVAQPVESRKHSDAVLS